jgi:hypothetical protein
MMQLHMHFSPANGVPVLVLASQSVITKAIREERNSGVVDKSSTRIGIRSKVLPGSKVPDTDVCILKVKRKEREGRNARVARGSFKRGTPFPTRLVASAICPTFLPTCGLAKTCEAQMTKSQETPIPMPAPPS